MRLRDALVRALLLAALLCGAGARAQPVPPALDASSVQAAASAVRADPLLGGSEKTRVLRLKKTENGTPPAKRDDARWWLELLSSLSTGLRVAVWLVGAGLLIAVLLRLRDWLAQRQGGGGAAAPPPTHVGTLDIRPESLPADIGAAARGLWQGGDARAALSLLYRGALSRLVHGHGVPIRAASTEGDCLALAAPRLAPASQAFLAQLVAGWQGVAYGRRELPDEQLEQLCADFETRMSGGLPA